MPHLTPCCHIPALEKALALILAGSARIVVPEASGLHRRRPNSHFHPTPEFFFQAGGGSDFECPSGKFRLRTGDMCVMPAGVPHAETPLDLRTPYRLVVLLRAENGFIAIRGEATRERQIHSKDVVGFLKGGQAFQCLELAALASTIEVSFRESYIQALGTAFLTSVLTEMRNPFHDLEKEIPPVVREAGKIVRVEISKPGLSVNGIAVQLGISPDHLTRLFRKTHGMSLGVWIAKERIQLACELLARPDHNISEVGWACGFASTSYFIRVFRTYAGTTPKEWRISAANIRYFESKSGQ